MFKSFATLAVLAATSTACLLQEDTCAYLKAYQQDVNYASSFNKKFGKDPAKENAMALICTDWAWTEAAENYLDTKNQGNGLTGLVRFNDECPEAMKFTGFFTGLDLGETFSLNFANSGIEDKVVKNNMSKGFFADKVGFRKSSTTAVNAKDVLGEKLTLKHSTGATVAECTVAAM